MKKILFLVCIAFLTASCEDQFLKDVKFTKGRPHLRGLAVFEYDSCEYVLVYKSVTHKGNCKYCKQRRDRAEQQAIPEVTPANNEYGVIKW